MGRSVWGGLRRFPGARALELRVRDPPPLRCAHAALTTLPAITAPRPPRYHGATPSPLSRRHALPHLCGFASFVCGRTHTLDAETHKSSRNDRRSGRGGAAATAIGVLISAPLAYTANTGSHRYSGVPQRFRWLSRRTTGAQTRAGRDAAAQRGGAQRGAAVSTARCRTPAASPLTSLATPTALTALSADHSLRRLCGFASFVRGRAHTLDAETHRSRRNGGRSPAQPGGRGGTARGRDVHPAHRSRTPQTPEATAIAVYPSVFGVPGRAARRGAAETRRAASPREKDPARA